jgi:hypothetical protein
MELMMNSKALDLCMLSRKHQATAAISLEHMFIF